MTIANVLSLPATSLHDTRREGVKLGVIVATVIWCWIAVVDAVVGQPFHTFTMLGGVLAFTVVHYALNVTYAIVLLSAIHGAERTPSLIIGLLFWLITFQGGFAMFTNLLAEARLGPEAWIAIFGGNIIGLVTAFVLLSRKHPLASYVKRAEDEN